MATVMSPYWFLGVDSIFDVVTLIVMFLIGLYSYRIYKLSGQKQYMTFFMAFMLLAVGYFIKALGDLGIFLVLKEDLTVIETIMSISGIIQVEMFLFSIFVVSGYLMLFMMQHKIQDMHVKAAFFLVVFLTSLIVLMMWQPFVHIINFALLALIVISFYKNYLAKKNVNTFAVFLSFALIAVSELLLIFSFHSSAYYAIGHVIHVTGSVILLCKMSMVLKR